MTLQKKSGFDVREISKRRRLLKSNRLALEALEPRLVLSTLLGEKPLIYDPSPGNPTSGDEVTIGKIKFEQVDEDFDANPETFSVQVTYAIDAPYQAKYDLSAIETKVNLTPLISPLNVLTTAGLPSKTESAVHNIFRSPLCCRAVWRQSNSKPAPRSACVT